MWSARLMGSTIALAVSPARVWAGFPIHPARITVLPRSPPRDSRAPQTPETPTARHRSPRQWSDRHLVSAAPSLPPPSVVTPSTDGAFRASRRQGHQWHRPGCPIPGVVRSGVFGDRQWAGTGSGTGTGTSAGRPIRHRKLGWTGSDLLAGDFFDVVVVDLRLPILHLPRCRGGGLPRCVVSVACRQSVTVGVHLVGLPSKGVAFPAGNTTDTSTRRPPGRTGVPSRTAR